MVWLGSRVVLACWTQAQKDPGSVKVALKCLIVVVLDAWTLKVEHVVTFTAIFSTICTAHAQKRLFTCMNFRCKFRHRGSIRRANFSIRLQTFSDLATFSVDFCILYAECQPYFYFRFVWPTDLESIPHASTPTSIIPNKFEVDMTIHCRVIAFLYADTSRDLVNFALLTLNSWSTWRVTWPTLLPSLNFEDPTPINSWLMSHNVSPWLPLRMHTRPLRMRQITWPVSRGSKTVKFLESPTPICLFTIPLRWLYDEYY